MGKLLLDVSIHFINYRNSVGDWHRQLFRGLKLSEKDPILEQCIF